MRDDNDFFNDWDAAMTAQLEKFPVCDCCGEHIQDGYLYRIYGDVVCPACLQNYIDDNFFERIPAE